MFLCSIPLLSALISGCVPDPVFAVGYVEGEYVLLAPIETARIEALYVRRGDWVERGTEIVALDERDATIRVAQAEAALARTESELSDLKRAARAEEIAGAEAAVEAAGVESHEAARELARARQLFERGVATRFELDLAETKSDLAAANVRQQASRLSTLKLPARADRISAASASVSEAAAALDAAEWSLNERRMTSPVTGRVTELYRFTGDLAGPQAPILSILPVGAVKLRFYVPERSYSRIALGTDVRIDCDGCAGNLSAKVSYLAESPEFTPPVIYSLDARQKLVYLAEARPLAAAPELKPGQIVDVRLREIEP